MWLLQSINAVFLFRKSKDDAKKVLSQLPPFTPGCKASDDPAWTPGQWRAEQGYKDAMSDEKPVRQTVLQVYNDAIKQIAGMTDVKSIEPLTFRLKCEWDVATKNEQMICKEKLMKHAKWFAKSSLQMQVRNSCMLTSNLRDRTAKLMHLQLLTRMLQRRL